MLNSREENKLLRKENAIIILYILHILGYSHIYKNTDK